jgi:hypothetical protein
MSKLKNRKMCLGNIGHETFSSEIFEKCCTESCDSITEKKPYTQFKGQDHLDQQTFNVIIFFSKNLKNVLPDLNRS